MSGTINNQLPSPSIGSKGQDKKSIKSSLKESLEENSGFKPEDAEKIATAITAKLKGKENYTEEDVFKAAKIYDFQNGKNNGILIAIEGLDPDVNIDYKYEDGKDTQVIWREAISQSSKDSPSDIESSSVERPTKNKREITEGPLSKYVKTGEDPVPGKLEVTPESLRNIPPSK
jgi:hypothetical protein